MNIKLMRMNKMINSTSRTAIATYDTKAQYLNPCSDLNPELELHVQFGDHEISYYNMIKIEDKYYNINDIVYENYNLCRVSCSIDVLATYKDYITTTSQYVTRTSDIANCDPYAIDDKYPALANKTIYQAVTDNVFTSTQGYYILGIICEYVSTNIPANALFTFGSVTYVAMTRPSLYTLISKLSQEHGFIADLNPLQYITTCFYVPFTPASTTEATIPASTLKIGGVTFSVALNVMTEVNMETLGTYNGIYKNIKTGVLLLPTLAHDRGYGYNSNPYTKYYLYAGPFGTIELDSASVIGQQALKYAIDYDTVTGSGKLTILNNSDKLLHEITAQVGVFCQISQISRDSLLGLASAGIGVVSAAATGNAIGVVSGVLSAADSIIPKVSSVGNNGSLIDFVPQGFRVVAEKYSVADEPELYVYGRPCLRYKTMEDFTTGAFIQIDNPVISIPGAKNPEIEALITFMQNGFYLE